MILLSENKRKKLRKDIQKDLTDQLERNGTTGEYYQNMVSDYMSLWDVKVDLENDIVTRGVKVEKFDSRGQQQIVTNESVDEIRKTNTQMLRIMDALGIKAVEAESSKDDQDRL